MNLHCSMFASGCEILSGKWIPFQEENLLVCFTAYMPGGTSVH